MHVCFLTLSWKGLSFQAGLLVSLVALETISDHQDIVVATPTLLDYF